MRDRLKGCAPVYVWLLLEDCRRAHWDDKPCPCCKLAALGSSDVRACKHCVLWMFNDGPWDFDDEDFMDAPCTVWGRKTLCLLETALEG